MRDPVLEFTSCEGPLHEVTAHEQLIASLVLGDVIKVRLVRAYAGAV